MVFGFDTLNEISIIAAIDGIDCSAHESVLGYYGLIIWISLAIYLMIGQFVICEEYFVPILSALGDRWHMPEDVQGATLLAVGSSSPELFTAILGVIFYPHDNPGPGTNVGSAVFNMCVIVGLSAIFAPKTAKLQIIPFLRDSIAYMIGLIELYLFYKIITPKYMDIWESILLTMWWIIYVIIVYRTDLLASRCCCCVSPHVIEATVKEIQITHDYVRLNENNNISINNSDNNNNNKLPSHRPSFFKKPSVINKSLDGEHFGVQFDNRGHPITDPEYITETDNIHIAPGALNGNDLDEDLQKLLDELNRKQRQNVNKGWVVVIMPQQHAHEKLNIPISSSADHNNNNNNQLEDIDEKNINNSIPLASGNNNNKKKKKSAHAYIRRRTLMETLSHERAVAEINEKYEEYNESHEEISRGGILLHKFLFPWTKLFSWTLPKVEGSFALNHIYITIILIILWLGILTFFVVDCAEKIGNCFNIPGGLLGITLLAVGSSLPDCISSIIVARQMKIDMAIANAFGSNIFDVNLCVGFSFILGSIANAIMGNSTKIYLGDDKALNTFSELIIAAAAFMIFLWLMIWCTLFRLEKWIGYILSISYVGYICVFTVLFVHDQDSGADEGES